MHQEFAGKVQFAVINAENIDNLRTSFELARKSKTDLLIDLGPLIAKKASAGDLSVTYAAPDGSTRLKKYQPVLPIKIRKILGDESLRTALAPYAKLMAEYQDQLKAVFLVDEPYLNGVSKSELERASRVIRGVLVNSGVRSPRIGVNFAAAEFDAGFGAEVAEAANRYVVDVEAYRDSLIGKPEFRSWDEAFSKARLTTYDNAGSLYAEGGIPDGVDFISFDFYVSTLLVDALHDRSLAWFARHTNEPACSSFKDSTMSSIRGRLSFFRDGPVVQDPTAQISDRALLDSIFNCRMRATVGLLHQAIDRSSSKPEILLIGESSGNGFVEFDKSGRVETAQPEKLIELRSFQETQRYIDFYNAHRQDFAGLAFFTFGDEHDASIALTIRGAAAMPSVTAAIFAASAGR